MRILSLCCFCLLLAACDGATRDRRAARGDAYVSAPDHLYFQNIRSRDYQSATLDEGIESYRHDALEGGGDLLLVEHWLEDRAELRLDGQVLTRTEVLELQRGLQTGKEERFAEDEARAAALEVVQDYLRLTGSW
ncbi:hypothetical protein LEM8419_03252 [Neolewinella maritima]|uniref:Uncharacterized protein n=1 Tax=Neolewinella maritima TaxID=1383882 RepID=A0ABM9B5Z5_9BACT|nr:hypothetical protein [Neolewinella maritima]CAH1002345.1 hypothetical protein LEM8419_03252 [Neolewinella maritima]